MKATPSVVLGLATAVGLCAGAAGVLSSGSALARSTDLRQPTPIGAVRPNTEPSATRGAPAFSENFDSYTAGSQMHGQGGWKGWFNDPAAGALVDNAFSLSSPNSVNIQGASDLVHEFSGFTSGLVTVTAQQYIPTGYAGESYFIMLNTYNDAGTGLNWSVQVKFNSATGLVESDGATTEATVSFVTDEWVELRLEIDLDNDTQSFFYDNQLLYTGTWTDEQGAGNGALNVGAIDLYANTATPVYYDDISVEFGVVDEIFANGFECETGFPGCDGGGGQINEGFEDVAALFTAPEPWIRTNHSAPVGPVDWMQNTGQLGTPGQQGGTTNSAIISNFEATDPAGTGTISDWLLTPPVTFGPTTTLSFYTRAFNTISFPDRLEVRVCSGSPCTDVGTTETDVGQFTTLLLTINPNLVGADDPTGANGYPQADFAQFTLTSAEGLPTSGTGRIAFRYFVTDAGGTGVNSSTIGIDTVVVE